MSVVTSVIGGINSNKLSRKSKRAAGKQADNVMAETTENIRRQRRSQERQQGQAEAGTYASGIQMSGMNEKYIADMANEFLKENEWLRQHGISTANAIRKGASIKHKANQISAISNVLGSGMNAADKYWGGT